MKKSDEELMYELQTIVAQLGWSIALPADGDDETVSHMIIGYSEVLEVLEESWGGYDIYVCVDDEEISNTIH